MAFAFALLAALVHGYIFYLERLRYGSPTFCRTFGIAREDLAAARAAFYNLAVYNLRPLQNSFFSDSRNLNKDFRLFLFQISTDSTQIPPLIPLGYLIIRHPGRLLGGNRHT